MKPKTHRSTHKRVTVRKKKNGTKTYQVRKKGQNHFNARATGNTTRKKRTDLSTHATERRTIEWLLPHA
jgi:ribosomal protein L35